MFTDDSKIILARRVNRFQKPNGTRTVTDSKRNEMIIALNYRVISPAVVQQWRLRGGRDISLAVAHLCRMQPDSYHAAKCPVLFVLNQPLISIGS